MLELEKKINEITDKLHTINPNITNELLDLLYEYNKTRQNIEYYDDLQSIKQCKSFLDGMLHINSTNKY